jgi:hypothetical protein
VGAAIDIGPEHPREEVLVIGQLTQIRDAWRTGTPLGNDRFKEEVEAMLGCKIGQVRRRRPKKTPSNTL